MSRINKIISFVYRFIKTIFLCVVCNTLKGVKIIIKVIIFLCNPLIERRKKIFFVIILPIIGNYLLVTNLELGICSFKMPVASNQDALKKCAEASAKVDPLSRISPSLAELLRYDFSLKNNFYVTDNQTRVTTSSLMIIKNEETGKEKRLSVDESYYLVAGNLNHSEAVDKLRSYAPSLELSGSSGTISIFGGWKLKYQPDTLSTIIQFFFTLVAWFQLVEIFNFLKK